VRKVLSTVGLLVVLAIVPVACSAAGTSTTSGSVFGGTLLEPPEPKPEFVLTDTHGQPFDFRTETEDRLTLLYFGYTFCPDICPVQLAQLAAVMDRLPDVERNSVVVFVTVDPERDTPEVIRSFLDKFDTKFVGLTGTVEQVEAAQRAAGVPVAVKIGDGADYSMGHAGQVIAYAPDGLAYTEYPYGTRQTQWVHDLPLIMDKS
jgi:protein SCO1/2